MNEFSTKEGKKLGLEIVEPGLTFVYLTASGQTGDIFQVGQSWSSIHSLLAKLRNKQRYVAKDRSLVVWKQGGELHVKFHSLQTQLEEECTFSAEETKEILEMLEGLPNLN